MTYRSMAFENAAECWRPSTGWKYLMMPKRLLDLAGAASALLLLSPILVAVAVAIRLFLGRPVFFRQTRPGYLEKPFTIYKFRTMHEGVDSQGAPLPDGERLGWVGRFLRRMSLDELPELWNVLRGDMSLVGPRPLLMRYLPFYAEEERIRFKVRPGITGWAQVNGRNEAGWDDRLRKDIWYVRNESFLLDIKILRMTVAKVLSREQVIVDARSAMLNLDEERAGLKVDRV
jgi:lipopolysaccharide/colanic/teichoic acid biosynthesis glycosyltransferase